MKHSDECAPDRTRKFPRFMRFVLVGGLAASVNIVSRIGLSFMMAYEIAIIGAYVCGMTTAYVLNKKFVFSASGRGAPNEYLRFALVNIAAVAQVWIVSVGLARIVVPWLNFDFHAETVAHVIGVTVPVVSSYFGHKHFSFAKISSSRPSAESPGWSTE